MVQNVFLFYSNNIFYCELEIASAQLFEREKNIYTPFVTYNT